MKKTQLILLLFLSFQGFLASRIFNSKLDSSGNYLVDSVTDVNILDKVMQTSKFKTSVFDEQRKVMYLGNETASLGAHSVMRAKFVGDRVELKAIGSGVLSAKSIAKLDLTKDGHLVVMEKPTNAGAANSKFWVIKNPWDEATVLESPDAMDAATPTPAPGNILNLVVAGQKNGKDRIVVFVAVQNVLVLNATPAKSVVRIFEFDASTESLVVSADQAKVGTDVLNFNLGSTAGSLANLLGGSSCPTIPTIGLKALCWDDSLKRLFVGTTITTNALCTTNSCIMVARFAADTGEGTQDLLCERFAPQAVTTDALSTAVGTTSKVWKISKLQTMWSSSLNRPHLVVHVSSSNSALSPNNYQDGPLPRNRTIYALPLVYEGGAVADLGKLKKTSDNTVASAPSESVSFFKNVATNGSMSWDVRALVGGLPFPEIALDNLSLQVVRDTVYVVQNPSFVKVVTSLIEDTIIPKTAVWASSALYDEAGEIKGWTAWQQVFSSAAKITNVSAVTYSVNPLVPTGGSMQGFVIKDFYVSAGSGEIFYLARNNDVANPTVDAPINHVGVINFATKDPSKYLCSSNGLLDRLNQDFADTGIWTAASFPAITTLGLGNSGLAIVASKNKCAIFSTGALASTANPDLTFNGENASTTRFAVQNSDATGPDNPSHKPFMSMAYESSHYATDRHYHLFSDLDGIGTVSCIEVGRVTNNLNKPAAGASDFPKTHGFIFVGGEKGLAVLRKSDGSGFDASNTGGDLTTVESMSVALEDFSTNLNLMSFKKIPGVDGPVIGLVSTGEFLYVLQPQKLLRIRLYPSGLLSTSDFLRSSERIFEDNWQNHAATMFKDEMSTVFVPASVDLSNLGSEYDSLSDMIASSASSLTPAGNKVFQADLVVVQEILSLSSDEFFVQLCGYPNSDVMFAASLQGNGSNLYAIKNAGRANGANVLGEHYLYRLPYYVRRMYLETVNHWSRNLGSDENALNDIATPTTKAIGGTGLYGSGVGLIANLHILSGSFEESSSLYSYAINGNIGGQVDMSKNFTTAEQSFKLSMPQVLLDSTADWIKPIPSLTKSLPKLCNGVDFVGNRYAYAHGYASQDNNMLLRLDYNSGSFSRPEYSAIPDNSLVYGSMRLESGAQLLFGWPFVARVCE